MVHALTAVAKQHGQCSLTLSLSSCSANTVAGVLFPLAIGVSTLLKLDMGSGMRESLVEHRMAATVLVIMVHASHE